MDIQFDTAMQTLDPNAQSVIVDAAQQYIREKQAAPPTTIAPADAGRASDEQYPAPIDAIRLLDTTTTQAATIYEIEISAGGNVDHVGVTITNDGTVQVRGVE
ncbi:MAG TPA: hypothetical protein VFZ66_26295 [Herpetosiphonaceae bacterium]